MPRSGHLIAAVSPKQLHIATAVFTALMLFTQPVAEAQPLLVPGTSGLDFRDLTIYGSYGLGSVQTGLVVLDMVNPATPTIVASLPLGTRAGQIVGHYRIRVRNNLAFVPMWEGGFHIVNVSDPTTPFEVGHAVTPQPCRELLVVDDYLYAGGYDIGVMIYDVSTPATPQYLGATPEFLTIRDLAVRGNRLFVAGFQVYTYDISDRANPTSFTTIIGTARANAVVVRGSLAFVTDEIELGNGLGGLAIFDVPDFGPHQLLSYPNDHDFDSDVKLANRVAYVSSESAGGLHAIDISDPNLPRAVKCFDGFIPGCAGLRAAASLIHQSVTLHDRFAYVSAREDGLFLYALDPRGDCNEDGTRTTVDIILLVNYVFKGGPPPAPLDQGDTDCFDDITSTDIIALVNFVFKSGDPLVCP